MITLEKVLENNEFLKILFIKIDAQGFNFYCLESAGNN